MITLKQQVENLSLRLATEQEFVKGICAALRLPNGEVENQTAYSSKANCWCILGGTMSVLADAEALPECPTSLRAIAEDTELGKLLVKHARIVWQDYPSLWSQSIEGWETSQVLSRLNDDHGFPAIRRVIDAALKEVQG